MEGDFVAHYRVSTEKQDAECAAQRLAWVEPVWGVSPSRDRQKAPTHWNAVRSSKGTSALPQAQGHSSYRQTRPAEPKPSFHYGAHGIAGQFRGLRHERGGHRCRRKPGKKPLRQARLLSNAAERACDIPLNCPS
jgi:hypothetical protein